MKWLKDPPDVHDYYDEWYWPVGAGVAAAVLAVALIAQRQAVEPALWAALTASPWLVDASLVRSSKGPVPIPLFTAVVVVGVLGLLSEHVYNDYAPFFLVLLVAEMASRLPLPGGLLVTGVAMLAMLSVELRGDYDDSFIWFVAVALGWAGGFCVQIQFKLMAEMRASQANVAERAAAEERQRIAREIHDVVAHTLSVTMLQVTGARLALERGDRADAVAALHDAERLGRESLTDIRRTVGVLGAEPGPDAPLPTAVDLPELVAGFRAAGLDIELDVQGDVAALPPATGLGVYRITQESLTNVAKHAPTARTDVGLVVDDDAVRLMVRDHDGRLAAAPPSDNGGLGVRGMCERAGALGGTLDAGPDGDGWLVEATLPRSDARPRRRC